MSVARIGNIHARNLSTSHASIVHTIDPVKDWPASRQLALMLLRRIEWVKTVTTRLQQGTVMAQRHDWRWLKANGYIERHDKTGFLIATALGADVAETLAWHHAKELRLHIFKPTAGGEWHRASTRCSCGWAAGVARSSPQLTQARIHAARSHHLTQVENGTYKPARAVAEILAEVIKGVEESA